VFAILAVLVIFAGGVAMKRRRDLREQRRRRRDGRSRVRKYEGFGQVDALRRQRTLAATAGFGSVLTS